MAVKTRTAESLRTDVDVRPQDANTDPRNSNTRPSQYPGKPPADGSSLPSQAPSSIRSVRVSDVPGLGSGPLGSMEIAGKTQSVPKVPPQVKFASIPMTGAGPIEMQRLEQQQKNAIALGDPDYAPQRELDYESVKDANQEKLKSK